MHRICRLAFKEYGDRTLPTLVLLMGLGMPSGAWPESLIRLLVQQGLHVITEIAVKAIFARRRFLFGP